MPTFTVVMTETRREIWTQEIQAESVDEAYEIADELEHPLECVENIRNNWKYDTWNSEITNTNIEIEEK